MDITPEDVQEIAGVVPDRVVKDFARCLGVDVQGDGTEGYMDVDMDMVGGGKRKGFDAVRGKVKELMMEGFSASQLLSQVSPQAQSWLSSSHAESTS